MQNKRKVTTYDIVIVGIMAALIFVANQFLKIGPIPTPAGPTMLKMANVLCLLGGILFGNIRGGLAAGIGSMMFDLTNPAFVPSAPFTLVFYFIMGFVCGTIAHTGGKEGESFRRNLIAAIVASLCYTTLFISKSMITLTLEGSTIQAAFITSSTKLITSLCNAAFSIAVSVLIAPVCRKALVRAGFAKKLFPSHAQS